MHRRLLLPLIAGIAMISGVASANPDYWRREGLLLEVSADPRDGTDYVRVNPQHARRLAMVALHDIVDLRGMVIHYADGRAFQPRYHGLIRPGQRVLLDLPPTRAPIVMVELDYGHPELRRRDRTPARLRIYPADGYDRFDRFQHRELSSPYYRRDRLDPGYRHVPYVPDARWNEPRRYDRYPNAPYQPAPRGW
jgi:hypothetical protein